MTEAEALDMAARAAGWEYYNIARYNDGDAESIRAHAKTLMENAALKARAEIERDLRQQVKDDGCVVSGDGVSMVPTAMWIDAQVSLESIAALKAENERLREALGLLSAVELTIPADRIRDDDHVIITYKTFRALRTALERIDHD